jgi:pseudouridine-5'-phosphate glycosidase
MNNLPLLIKDEVKEALDNGKAVVALESTIITHGMHYPVNRDTALAVE